eukprot:7513580-Alexandrium_andersonii.AAC.1
MALGEIRRVLRKHGRELPVVFWAATDSDETCRGVLLCHDGPDGNYDMQRVFGNILDRAPPRFLRQLEEI